MFVDYIHARRATSNFAEQRAAYLNAEIQRSADELAKASSPIGKPKLQSAVCTIPVVGAPRPS